MGDRQNDCEVYWDEYSILDFVGVLDEEIGAEALLVARGYEVVEADETLLELLCWGTVQACEYDGKDGWEVLLYCRSR